MRNKPLFPPKLRPGDHLRVIALSTSLAIVSDQVRQQALQNLETLGFSVSFGQHVEEIDDLASSSVASRLEDFHAAFEDPNVDGILTAIGGYNANQLLSHIDYPLIQSHPKVFCGYSDITALNNAIFARTGLVTYSGPHFSSFGMQQGLEYTLEYFQKCLMQPDSYVITQANQWSDDPWYRDQEARTFHDSQGWLVIHPGSAQGHLLGGNLCTLNLLQGTPFMPDLDGSLLLLEDDEESYAQIFDRDFQSLLHLPSFTNVRGVLIGRFQIASNIDCHRIQQLVVAKPELESISVVAEADFGHTTPQFTFPIGGTARLEASPDQVTLTILEH